MFLFLLLAVDLLLNGQVLPDVKAQEMVLLAHALGLVGIKKLYDCFLKAGDVCNHFHAHLSGDFWKHFGLNYIYKFYHIFFFSVLNFNLE